MKKKQPSRKKTRRRPLAPLKPEPNKRDLTSDPFTQIKNLTVSSAPPPPPPKPNYAEIEYWAKQVLERAGIPYDGPGARYSIPDGWPPGVEGEAYDREHRFGTLPELAEARGFRRRATLEWYAAAILHQGFSPDPKLDRLIEKAQVIADPASKRTRPGGKAKAAKETAKREPEWAKWKEWKAEYEAKFPKLKGNNLAIAEKIQGRILRVEKKHVGIRTITNHI